MWFVHIYFAEVFFNFQCWIRYEGYDVRNKGLVEMQVSVCVSQLLYVICSLVKLLLAKIIACGHNKVAESNSKNEKA